MIAWHGVSSSELPKNLQASASGASHQPRKSGQTALGSSEIRVQLCTAPPPPDVWRKSLSREHVLSSPPRQMSVNFSPHWVMCHVLPTPKPARYTESPVFRPHLQISEVKRKRDHPALGPWASHSLSLDLSVPSIKQRVAVLPRVSPSHPPSADTAPTLPARNLGFRG